MSVPFGYGWSFEDVYFAMKIAKAQPGKKLIIGIEFQVNGQKDSKSA
jgi:hypothetical protein